MEVPGVIKHLPQGSWVGDDREWRTPSSSRNGNTNWRNGYKLWTRHKNSTGNIALQATGGETPWQALAPKCAGETLEELSSP